MKATTRPPQVPSEPMPELAQFLAPFRVRFRQSNSFRVFERYITGLLTQHPNKNCETMAEVVPGANAPVLAHLLTLESGAPPVYLWGPPGSGKSHLLHAVVERAQQQGASIAWFEAAVPAPWQAPEHCDWIVLDDCQALADEPVEESGLADVRTADDSDDRARHYAASASARSFTSISVSIGVEQPPMRPTRSLPASHAGSSSEACSMW